MIARIVFPILVMILVADVFVDLHYLRRIQRRQWFKRMLWWLPAVFIIAYTIYMATLDNFAPESGVVLNTYLFLLGLIVIPKFVFALCSVVGWSVRRVIPSKRNYGHWVGLALVFLLWWMLFYGSTRGFSKIEVRQVDFYSEDLPQSFDGYRIVQFSDAHVGTYGEKRQHILDDAVSLMNGLKPDAIVFTGDLQNMQPAELYPQMLLLSELRAPDGVFSVLGNHDYAAYIHADEKTKAANCQEMVDLQRHLGWTLLRNEHRVVRRGSDSIVVAGMENLGQSERAPKRGDVKKTLVGVSPCSFVVMLQHDPTAWETRILPQSHAQLTLSGHTHAAQLELLGWSPASWIYKEWGGMYYQGDRAINVSTGLGGFVPFRFGVPGEVVVITLHKKKQENK